MEFKKFKSLGTGGLILAGALFTTSANAADGCKFLLCMGAVNPMGISECAPTVKEVLEDLSRGKGLPTCSLSSGLSSKTSGNYVDYTRASYIPSCPSGMTFGRDGVHYHQGEKPDSSVHGGVTSVYHRDTGNSLSSLTNRGHYSSRVCVGGQKLGTGLERYRSRGEWKNRLHEWYEKVSVSKPDGAKYEFSMFVDGKLHSNHRF